MTPNSPFPFILAEAVDLKMQFRLWMHTQPAVHSTGELGLEVQPHARIDFAHGPLQLPPEGPAVTYLHFPRLLSPEIKRRLLRIETAYEVSGWRKKITEVQLCVEL